MIKIVIVGDEPSKTNIRDDIAFVGAKCFPTLVKWIKELNPDYYVCLNSYRVQDLAKIESLYNDGFKVIALGKKASDRVNFINHYPFLHPSGLNRKLNDKEYVKERLRDCKSWLLI